jgi:hypothetical protein
MTTKSVLHQLVEQLPDCEVPAAARYLRYLRDTLEHDPIVRFLDAAPEEDEPTTPEETAALEEGWEAYKRGDVLSDAHLRRELGL